MSKTVNPSITSLEELSETYNHFLPHLIRTLEKEGAFKYDKSGVQNETVPFSSEPKIDMNELKKYQVVFTGKNGGFFSKYWREFWSSDDTYTDDTYTMRVIKIITDETYGED